MDSSSSEDSITIELFDKIDSMDESQDEYSKKISTKLPNAKYVKRKTQPRKKTTKSSKKISTKSANSNNSTDSQDIITQPEHQEISIAPLLNLPSYQFYCMKCKKYKRSIKTCVKAHHSIVQFNPYYKYPESIAKFGEKIWKHRFVKLDPEPIDTYIYGKNIQVSCLCPLHQQPARGFCFDCDRLFCFEKKTHFSHKHILFADFGIENEKSFTSDDAFDAEYHINVVKQTSELIKNKDSIFADSRIVQRGVLGMLAQACAQTCNSSNISIKPSPSGSSGSDILTSFIIQAMNVVNGWNETDFDNDIKETKKVYRDSTQELKRLSFTPQVQTLILLYKLPKYDFIFPQQHEWGNYSFFIKNSIICLETHNNFGNYYIYGNRWNRDDHLIKFSVRNRFTDLDVNISLNKLLNNIEFSSRRYDVPHKIKHRFRDMDCFTHNFESIFYYICDNSDNDTNDNGTENSDNSDELDKSDKSGKSGKNKSTIHDIIYAYDYEKDEEIPILCPKKFERLINVYFYDLRILEHAPDGSIRQEYSKNNKYEEFPIAVAASDKNPKEKELWYYIDQQWHRLSVDLFNDDVKMCVMTPGYERDPNYASFVSDRYIHRIMRPSIPISCIDANFSRGSLHLMRARSITSMKLPL